MNSGGLDIDVFLIKTDGNGIEQWTKTFGGNYEESGRSVQQTTDNGYIIAGFSASFSNIFANRPYLIKTDENGIEEWTQILGDFVSGESYSVQQTTDGGYITCGQHITNLSDFYNDAHLIKTDGNGNVTSTFNITLNPNRKLEKTVDILGKETKSQTNTPLIEIYDDGSTEKKMIIE